MLLSTHHITEALALLGGDIWEDGECADEAQRLFAAYTDPQAHLDENADDEFVLEGLDADDPETAAVLLRWLMWDALTPAFYDGDDVIDWAEAGAERLGLTPTPQQMLDADERHRLALVELHADTPPQHLLQIDNGFSDDVAYLVVDRAQLQRTMILVRELKLLISDTATPVATWSRRLARRGRASSKATRPGDAPTAILNGYQAKLVHPLWRCTKQPAHGLILMQLVALSPWILRT